jgi:hypothetical protein
MLELGVEPGRSLTFNNSSVTEPEDRGWIFRLSLRVLRIS